jgi:ABC-type spermidine/putrescine transport system permease subunit I
VEQIIDRTAPRRPAEPIGGLGRKPRARLGSSMLLLPACLLYGGLMLLPLAAILRYGFAGGSGRFGALLSGILLRRAAENTLVISLMTTVIAVLLGFLLAAALWRSGPRLRSLLLAIILLPFWTGVLVKNFAWAALLQDNGVINTLLQATGLTDRPVTLLHNRLAVVIGMVHYVLPYAVFPIYTALRGIDVRVERAARSLGAGTPGVFRWVILPLAMPGVANAALLVFIMSAGFFITPVILGAPSDLMVSNLVDYYVHELVDFNSAAALAVLIVAAVTPVIVAQQVVGRRSQHGNA